MDCSRRRHAQTYFAPPNVFVILFVPSLAFFSRHNLTPGTNIYIYIFGPKEKKTRETSNNKTSPSFCVAFQPCDVETITTNRRETTRLRWTITGSCKGGWIDFHSIEGEFLVSDVCLRFQERKASRHCFIVTETCLVRVG